MMMAGTLRDWLYGFSLADAPRDILEHGRYRLLDTVGLCIAAGPTPLGRSIHDGAVDLAGGEGAATVIGFGTKCPPQIAAMVNGTLAHAMDFDDTHLPSLLHPSAPLVSAALAVAECHGKSGADVLNAVIAGNEIACRIAMAAPGAFHRKGLHPTGIVSTPVVALVCARLMGLDRDKALHALGIACSQASGLLESYQDGTWVKTLHPGWSAHGGIVAAQLAKAGFTGPSTGLDGRFGLLRAMLDGPTTSLDEAAVTKGLGDHWESRSNFYKLYPCAQVLLPFIELAVAARGDISGRDRVIRIRADIPARYIPVVCEPRPEKIAPKTNTHARASLAYAVAVAMVYGRVGMDDYTDDAIHDPEVLSIAGLVEHAALEPVSDGDGFAGALTVELTDGSSWRRDMVSRMGHPQSSETPRQVEEKFRQIAGGIVGAKRSEQVLHAIKSIETQEDISRLLTRTVV